MDITTADGHTVSDGAYVFNFYDLKWGHVDMSDVNPEHEALHRASCEKYGDRYDGPWFHVKHDDGTGALLNGDRISTRNLTGMAAR
jgi:uncharacterized protein involved in tellurium resistance